MYPQTYMIYVWYGMVQYGMYVCMYVDMYVLCMYVYSFFQHGYLIKLI